MRKLHVVQEHYECDENVVMEHKIVAKRIGYVTEHRDVMEHN